MALPFNRWEDGIMKSQRRQLLVAAASFGIAGLSPPLAFAVSDDDEKTPANEKRAEEISATEDLMREHGVLNRILLVYEEGLRRLREKDDVSPEVFLHSAKLVRKFVEDYHERLEENFIFPEFEKRKKLVDLVKVLRNQHKAGRTVTDVVLRVAQSDQFRKPDSRKELVRATEAFIRMYRPHEAREDTVLFPALHAMVPGEQLAELGEKFEEEEDRLFGDEGFEKTVEQVAAIEKQLGIDDLALFTPKVPQ